MSHHGIRGVGEIVVAIICFVLAYFFIIVLPYAQNPILPIGILVFLIVGIMYALSGVYHFLKMGKDSNARVSAHRNADAESITVDESTISQKCPSCGRTGKPGERICLNCGAEMKEVILSSFKGICPTCGKKGKIGERFCKKCGTELTERRE
jgi:ribosomal protein L32